MYQYECEKHGPWTDQHANRRATYDCPNCYTEQQTRYANLYHREVVATQLLIIANTTLTGSDTLRRLANQLADVVATTGTASAQGWLEGWWYSAGNNHPDNNAAWKQLRSVLGTV